MKGGTGGRDRFIFFGELDTEQGLEDWGGVLTAFACVCMCVMGSVCCR
jgi:hypothetical protein